MIWAGFILGLVGGMHCVGMCGPILLALPIQRKKRFRSLFNTSYYHFGRILSYSLLGFLFGSFGRGIHLAGFQQQLSILTGIIIILSLFYTSPLLPQFIQKAIQPLKLKLGSLLQQVGVKKLVAIGILNGFLPCGLVYVALTSSIELGSPLQGAIYMAFFGLGTFFFMSILFFTGTSLNSSLRAKISKIIPIFVFILGVLFILRGLGLGIPYISPSDIKLQPINNSKDCVNLLHFKNEFITKNFS